MPMVIFSQLGLFMRRGSNFIMNTKIAFICMYVVLIYWASSHFSVLNALFYPTLGAFCFLFISRTFDFKELSIIAIGAVISSVIGTTLFLLLPGVLGLLINTVLTIWLIQKFKWNAPPILAVSFIPYFTNPSSLWIIPLSVLISLLGLLMIVYLATAVEKRVFKYSALLRVGNKVNNGIHIE
jgi:hypothetical protein